MALSSFMNVKVLKGSVTAVSGRPASFVSDAASFSWSKAGRFWLRGRVDDDELEPALHRPPVPEPGRLLDPGGGSGNVDGERVVLLPQALRALVVGGGDLRRRGHCQCEEAQAPKQDRLGEAGAVERSGHAGDSNRPPAVGVRHHSAECLTPNLDGV